MLALVLGLVISAGLYFAYLWPSVEPVDPADEDAPATDPATPAEPAAAAADDAASPAP